jgi:hypothetical protein
MRRIVVLFAVIVVVVGLAALGRGSLRTSAQEVDELAGHPLVGTWLAMVPAGASPETFFADGTFVASPPIIEPRPEGVTFLSPLIGTWESTGERSGRFTAVQALSDATGAYTGTLTIDGHLEVSEDGQSFVDDSPETTLTVRDAANAVVAVINPYQDGGGSIAPVTGIRMGVGSPGFPEAAAAPATPAT